MVLGRPIVVNERGEENSHVAINFVLRHIMYALQIA